MKATFLIFLLIQLLNVNIADQDVDLNFYYKDYIKSMGYKLEEHEVITEDGYKLTLWHIIQNKSVDKNKVVYFQPGFLCTAWVFFQLGKYSLPFMLTDLGYDVWIGNNRGTIFSLDHISKDPEDWNGDYWDFNMDDYVVYDLPASITYVRQTTGANQIDYIGHS